MIPELDGLAVIRARPRARRGADPRPVRARRRRRPDPRPVRGRRRLPAQAVLARRARRAGRGRSCAAPSAGRRSCHPGRRSCSATSRSTRRATGSTVGGEEIVLSALELRLLGALLEADGRVLTRDQLLDAIHGEGEGDVTRPGDRPVRQAAAREAGRRPRRAALRRDRARRGLSRRGAGRAAGERPVSAGERRR